MENPQESFTTQDPGLLALRRMVKRFGELDRIMKSTTSRAVHRQSLLEMNAMVDDFNAKYGDPDAMEQ